MWRDIDNVVKTDCRLCGGVGYYEVTFEYQKTKDRHRHQIVKAIRVYGTGLSKVEGYRTLTKCHLCNAAYYRGVPATIDPWPDGQIDELLSREEWNGDAKF